MTVSEDNACALTPRIGTRRVKEHTAKIFNPLHRGFCMRESTVKIRFHRSLQLNCSVALVDIFKTGNLTLGSGLDKPALWWRYILKALQVPLLQLTGDCAWGSIRILCLFHTCIFRRWCSRLVQVHPSYMSLYGSLMRKPYLDCYVHKIVAYASVARLASSEGRLQNRGPRPLSSMGHIIRPPSSRGS